MISFQHCDSGTPITVRQDPVTGGWEAVLDDNVPELGIDPDDVQEAELECQRIVRRLQTELYFDENRAARVIRNEFKHQAEVI